MEGDYMQNQYEVIFSEDNFKTKYSGVITEESPYFYFISSWKYGNRWIPKENCIIGKKLISIYLEEIVEDEADV
jgi:hypothetical protein